MSVLRRRILFDCHRSLTDRTFLGLLEERLQPLHRDVVQPGIVALGGVIQSDPRFEMAVLQGATIRPSGPVTVVPCASWRRCSLPKLYDVDPIRSRSATDELNIYTPQGRRRRP